MFEQPIQLDAMSVDFYWSSSFSTSLVLCSRRPRCTTLFVRLVVGKTGNTRRTTARTMKAGPERVVRRRLSVPDELFEATAAHHFTTSTRAGVRADEEPQTRHRANAVVSET